MPPHLRRKGRAVAISIASDPRAYVSVALVGLLLGLALLSAGAVWLQAT